MRKLVFVLVALALAASPTWAADPPRDGTKSVRVAVKGLTPKNAPLIRSALKQLKGVKTVAVNVKNKTASVTFKDGKTIQYSSLVKAIKAGGAGVAAGAPIAAVAGKFTIRISGLTEQQAKAASEKLAAYASTDKVSHDKGTFRLSFKKGKNLKFSTVWKAFVTSGGSDIKLLATPKLIDCWFFSPIPKAKKKKGG